MNKEQSMKTNTPWKERNDKIIAYREAHQNASMENIGKIFKISKQRVSQILARAYNPDTKEQQQAVVANLKERAGLSNVTLD